MDELARQFPPVARAPDAWRLRLALDSDVPHLEQLLTHSAQGLLPRYYSPRQISASLGPVFGIDRQLIHDGTYFVAEQEGVPVGCGGWSRRRAHYGGDQGRPAEESWLEPGHDAARIRAFFVRPDCVRRGIGRAILQACERAAMAAGFRRLEMVATLAGEPLYAAGGYQALERFEIALAEGLGLPVVRMGKTVGGAP